MFEIRDASGALVAIHERYHDPDGSKRYLWRQPDGTLGLDGIPLADLPLYGIGRIDGLATTVVLVEGEKCAEFLWRLGIAAVGTVTGAAATPSVAVLGELGGRRVILWPDNDPVGVAHMDRIATRLVGIVARVTRIDWADAPAHGDAADFIAAGGSRLDVEELIGRAVLITGTSDQGTPAGTAATVQPPTPQPALAAAADILARFTDELDAAHVAGERRAGLLLFLVVVSRHLDRIVSIALKGPSAGGKSFITETVLRYFPASAYYALSAMSEHALAYSQEPLTHRMLVIYEAAGMTGDMQSYLIRSLLSEGRLRYETVEKTKAGLNARLIEREGPTGLIVTTTAIRLHPENETRLLSLTVDDSPAQTRAVLLAHAAGARTHRDVEPWHDLANWLAEGPTAVTIPFATALAEAIPPVSVRLRRDFPTLLSLIQAHALLHRATREVIDGQIVATIADYAAVRELVADLLAEGVERTVSDAIRETVGVVAALTRGGGATTGVAVAAALRIDESSASRRLRGAQERGFVRNLEDHRGHPSRLVVGEPLSDNTAILPSPAQLERLHGCSPGGGDGQVEPAYPDDVWQAEDASDAASSAVLRAGELA